MCFDYDSRPPELPADLACRPIAGGAAAELLTLESDDGTSFSAALAQAPEGDEPGVVIIPDVRGLYPFYIELAERFAEAGPSRDRLRLLRADRRPRPARRRVRLRTAPRAGEAGPGARRPRRHGGGAPQANGGRSARHRRILLRRLALVRSGGQSRPGSRRGGGSLRRPRPLPIRRPRSPDPGRRHRTSATRTFRGADKAIPQEQIDEFESALSTAGVEHEIHVYPGAPHSFFDRKQEEFAEESEDAWRRMLGFLAKTRDRAA